MDRRYLAAAIVLVTTFAAVNHGMRTGQLSAQRARSLRACLQSRYGSPSALAHKLLAEVRDRFMPGYPEEPQMLAEMNLPLIRAQARLAEQTARRNAMAAKCAHEAAERALQQAHRDIEKNIRLQEHPSVMVHPGVFTHANAVLASVHIPEQVVQTRVALAPLKGVDLQTAVLSMNADQMAQMKQSAVDHANLVVAESASAMAIPAPPTGPPCEHTRVIARKGQAQATRYQVRYNFATIQKTNHDSVHNSVPAAQTFASDYYY